MNIPTSANVVDETRKKKNCRADEGAGEEPDFSVTLWARRREAWRSANEQETRDSSRAQEHRNSAKTRNGILVHAPVAVRRIVKLERTSAFYD